MVHAFYYVSSIFIIFSSIVCSFKVFNRVHVGSVSVDITSEVKEGRIPSNVLIVFQLLKTGLFGRLFF